jgi:hypothetical protein
LGYRHQLNAQFMELTKPVQTGMAAEFPMKDFFSRITSSVNVSSN